MSEVSVVAPASYGQERLWLAAQLAQEATYHVRSWVRLPERTTLDPVQQALTSVSRRHESLRTQLELRDDALQQVVLRDVSPRVREHTAPGRSMEQVMLGDLPDSVTDEPLDIAAAPLWRAEVIRCVDGDVLLVVSHHAIFDAGSHPVLEREVRQFLRDPSASLPAVSPQPADVATWQRSQADGGALDQGVAYWRAQLEGAPPVHGLTLDGVRADDSGQPGADLIFRLAEGSSLRAVALGRELAATEFMVMFAAYAALVAKLSDETDVVVGVPVSDRDLTGADDAIGMFVNTIVLRLDLSDNPTFRELIGRVRERLLDGWEHSAVPLQLLAERMSYERIPGAALIYQLGFNHLGSTGLGRALGHAKDELFLELSDDDGRLEYRTDLVSDESARRCVARYAETVSALLADPDQRVGDLRLPSDDEAAAWEDGVAADAGESEGGTATAGTGSARPALTFAGETLNAGHLAAWSAAVAQSLATRGLGRGDVVAVESGRSLALIPTVLGVLRAGAVYLPLDPDLPAERRALMRERAGARHLLDAAEQQSLRPGADAVPSSEALASTSSEALTPDLLTGDDAAYVLFTSGSTGEPKGVVNTHRGLARRLAWMQDAYRLTESDVVLHKTPTSFDVSVWELLWPVLHGARVVVAEPEVHRDPRALAELAAREGVTVLHFVPSMLSAFLASGARLPDSVRQVVCSGEALPGALVRDLRSAHPHLAIDNLYGPTEAAIDVTREACQCDVPDAVPLGRPVPGSSLRVLDRRRRRVPVGVAGELFIAGEQVARGYVSRPGLTARAFVPDPYGPPGSVMYATGDRARWLPDGRLAYLGRDDDQVKVRGQRIELGEVQAALLAVPGVREGVALTRADAAGDATLVAFVTGEADRGTGDTATLEPSAIDAALRRRLPAGMVPTTITVLEAMPLTNNGKTDLAALLELATSAPEGGPGGHVSTAPSTVPATPAEHLVGELFGEVLGRPAVAPHESFFALGGHSLAAVRVLARVRAATGVDLPVSTLFSKPTPRELAQLLPADPVAAPTQPGAPLFAPRAAVRVDELDDDEVERALRAALARRGKEF